MRKMLVLALIVGVMAALAGVAAAERGDIGGIGTGSSKVTENGSIWPGARTMERGDIGGVGTK